MTARWSCIRSRKMVWVGNANTNSIDGGTAIMSLTRTHKTHKVTRRIHSPTCHLPQSAYPGNPFPSSSLSGKSMNTEGHLWRQVRSSLSKLHNANKPPPRLSIHDWLACAYSTLHWAQACDEKNSMLGVFLINISFQWLTSSHFYSFFFLCSSAYIFRG